MTPALRNRHRRRTWTFTSASLALALSAVAVLASSLLTGASTSAEGATPASTSSVFAETDSPQTPVEHSDRASVELGLQFSPKSPGSVTHIRFYKTPANVGPHVGTIWSSDGQVLATASFDSETSEGWQAAQLTSPVRVEAGASYVVSYRAPHGQYAADQGYFESGVETDSLRVPPGAGVYAYGAKTLPTENYNNSNYYVDLQFTPTPPDAPAPPRSSDGTGLELPTEAWWGGPSYYSTFPKAAEAGWADSGFFPIAVFFGKPEHADELASIGINTYMGAEHDGASMASITSEGISVIAQDEWTRAEVGDDIRVVGWHLSDECDMGYSGCTPDWDHDNGEYGRLEVQKQYADEFRARNDGRFLQANFGNGVLGTWWAPNTMDDHLALLDVSSVDKYAYTSPHVRDLLVASPDWPVGKDPRSAGAYGWQQDQMESFMNPASSKPNWVFVETAKPYLTEPGASTIAPEQIEGAVWNAIIHGAGGISYFQHNNNERCGNYSLVECSENLRDAVKAVNASVTSLAPVINTPSYVWRFGPGLDTSLKAQGGSAWIIAMTSGGTGERSFSLPAELAGSRTVEVVGENRTLDVVDGSFVDSFAAEHEHHVYRVSLR